MVYSACTKRPICLILQNHFWYRPTSLYNVTSILHFHPVSNIIAWSPRSSKEINTYMYTHTWHMALVGYLIVFSIVTKCGQTLEFLLWGTIVPLNFLVGYHCSIEFPCGVPLFHWISLWGTIVPLNFLVGYHCSIEFPCGVPLCHWISLWGTIVPLNFLTWGTIVPLNFLVGYHCSIVASTPQYPTTYGVWVHVCTY